MKSMIILVGVLLLPIISRAQSALIQLYESETSSVTFGENHDGYVSIIDDEHGMVIDAYGDRVRSVDVPSNRRLNTRFFLIYDSLTITSSRIPRLPYYLSSSRGDLITEITDRTGEASFAHGDQSEAYIASESGVIQIDIATQTQTLYDTPVKSLNNFAIADDAILWTGDGLVVTDRSLEVQDTLPGDASYTLPLIGDRFIYAIRTSGGSQEIVAYNYRLQVASRVTITLDTIIDMVYAKDGVHVLGRKNGSTTLASYRELLTTTDLSVWIDRVYSDMIVVNDDVLGLFTQDDKAYVDLDIFESTSDTLHRTINPSSYIHVNDIFTRMDPSGYMIGGPDFAYRTSKDSASTIFTGNIWHHVVTEDGSEAGQYTQYPRGDEEFSIYGMTDEAWKKAWRVSRKHIENFREDVSDGSIDEQIPHSILTWPSIGNPNLRGEFNDPLDLSQDLAPFVDRNGDGIYNAQVGDYPLIQGDEYVLRFHDVKPSTDDNISFVVMEAMYVYNRDDRDIQNSVFVETNTKYTGTKTIADYYQALWIDFDLGCYEDDNLGSVPSLDSWYVYNSNTPDTLCPSGVPAFGSDIPIQSVSLLDHEMYAANIFRFSSPQLPTCGPSLNTTEGALIKGLYPDGSPQYIGTDSCGVTKDSLTRYSYQGNPSNPDTWSMCSPTASYSSDLRALGSSRSETLSSEDFWTSTYLLYTSPPVAHPCPDESLWTDGLQNVQCQYKQGWLESQRSDHDTVYVFSGVISTPISAPQGDSYLWDNGEITQDITVLPGTYTVEVMTDLGCSIKQTYIVSISTSTENHRTLSWNLFPSPSKGLLEIQSNEAQSYQLEIFDLSGRCVHQEIAHGDIQRNFSEWAAGLYFVRFIDAQGLTDVKKWIKQ